MQPWPKAACFDQIILLDEKGVLLTFEVDVAVKDVVFPITKVDVGLSLQPIVFVGRETGFHTTHTVGSGLGPGRVTRTYFMCTFFQNGSKVFLTNK